MKNTIRQNFIKDALVLSVVNIIIRGISVSFNAFVNNKIGAESMGLLTLVMSVYGFAVTVALSCVNLAAVKLTSERCAVLHGSDSVSWKNTMRSVIVSVVKYSLLFGLSSGAVLYFSSGFISNKLLNDHRTLLSLKVLALSLPAISLSSAFSGFFTGLRKVRKNAIVVISEQFIKIIITSTALVMIMPGSIEKSCLAVVGGSAVAEAASLVTNIIMYITDTKRPDKEITGKNRQVYKTQLHDVSRISLPSAVGTYARQGLTTLEHIAIPKGIVKSGLSNEVALASYGRLQGISFPLVMFPYAIIGSFTSLLVPEVAELNEIKNKSEIRRIKNDVYRYCAMFSFLACGIFTNFSKELGIMIYSSSEAAEYTLILGLLVPFMYLDTTVDSILKGLGEQVYIMGVNIADAAAGLLLVLILTPLMAIKGYILTMWICEIGNLAASLWRLETITGDGVLNVLKIYIKPAVSFLIMTLFNNIFCKMINPVISICIFTIGYIVILYCFNCFGNKKMKKVLTGEK